MRLLSALILNTAITGIFVTASFGQNLPNNSSFFTGNPPILLNAQTPDNRVNWPNPHYYFTFKVPANCPESLGKITILPQTSANPINFNINNTKAFLGTQNHKGKVISITASQTKDGLISVVLNPPISPNTTFTISLEAEQNPSIGGVYQFTVQGFPSGENPVGLNLGVGRISIYSGFR